MSPFPVEACLGETRRVELEAVTPSRLSGLSPCSQPARSRSACTPIPSQFSYGSHVGMVHIWDRSRNRSSLSSPHTPLALIFCNPEFPPGLTPQVFQWWLNKGLLRTGDFLNGDQLHTIQYFKDEFQMPPREIFRYNQIASFARSKLNQVVGPPYAYIWINLSG